MLAFVSGDLHMAGLFAVVGRSNDPIQDLHRHGSARSPAHWPEPREHGT
jgi:hypothetical protein